MQGERGECWSKGKIPGTVEDAIEIKRKCESTCRNGPAFIRALLCDLGDFALRELYIHVYIHIHIYNIHIHIYNLKHLQFLVK